MANPSIAIGNVPAKTSRSGVASQSANDGANPSKKTSSSSSSTLPRTYYGYYRPGEDETIEVNCTSDKSKPAAALEWYVNGIKVSSYVQYSR